MNKAFVRESDGEDEEEGLSPSLKLPAGTRNYISPAGHRKLKDELERQGVILSDSKKAEKEKDYSAKLKDFQRFTKDAQDELQGKDEEFTRKILEGMEKIIQEFGRKNGYTFLFVKNEGMLFADEKADVTEEVLKNFNASRKK